MAEGATLMAAGTELVKATRSAGSKSWQGWRASAYEVPSENSARMDSGLVAPRCFHSRNRSRHS
eukprot:9486424-Pyramimonas_sp.AAC.1